MGNIGNDAEVRHTQGGMSVISFSVAHSEKWKDAQGQTQERTTWVRCSRWVKPDSTKLADYLKKGTKVFVEGQPSVSAWTDKDGNVQGSLELRVMSLEFGGSAVAAAPTATATPSQPRSTLDPRSLPQKATYQPPAFAANATDDDDDLPF